MANIKSIGGNPIVLGLDGLSDEVTHGYNPSLSVGRADALTGADSTAQWAQRTTEGSGAATVRSVQGAAVVWNQLVKPNPRSVTSKGVTFTNTSDGKVTFDGTATSAESFTSSLAFSVVNGHKYLYKGADTSRGVLAAVAGISRSINSESIYTATDDVASTTLSVAIAATYTGTYECYPQLFDLTQMFGSGNEPSTVEEFEQMYPEAYYPYSAPTLKPVQIAGIRSTDAQGGELDSVEWTAQTLRAAGSVADELTANELVTRVGVVDLGTLTWSYSAFGIDRDRHLFYAAAPQDIANAASSNAAENIFCGPYDIVANSQVGVTDKTISYGAYWMAGKNIYVCDLNYGTDAAAFKTAMNGVMLYYELATPTTTPISPALPMTYRVEQGGSESIIVPDGEISAAPVLTVAEGESAAELVMDALACIATPDGPTATSSHAVNTYLTMQGKLYKVTSAIAVGETIKSGTNVSQTTVMAELIARTA